MRCKWFFRNEPTEHFHEAPAFCVKSNCNPPEGHPAIDPAKFSPCCLAHGDLENIVLWTWCSF